jgi:hypothetical protein
MMHKYSAALTQHNDTSSCGRWLTADEGFGKNAGEALELSAARTS